MWPVARSALVGSVVAPCCMVAARTVEAQREPQSFIRFEAGRAEIHRASSTGVALALRAGRRIDRQGVARLDLGASYSGADEGYWTVEVGGELRLLARSHLTPVAGVGIGLLLEPEFSGEVIRATLAFDVKVGSRAAVRLGAQLGTHGGARGPNVLFGGIELRGRRL